MEYLLVELAGLGQAEGALRSARAKTLLPGLPRLEHAILRLVQDLLAGLLLLDVGHHLAEDAILDLGLGGKNAADLLMHFAGDS